MQVCVCVCARVCECKCVWSVRSMPCHARCMSQTFLFPLPCASVCLRLPPYRTMNPHKYTPTSMGARCPTGVHCTHSTYPLQRLGIQVWLRQRAPDTGCCPNGRLHKDTDARTPLTARHNEHFSVIIIIIKIKRLWVLAICTKPVI